ncbi:MAG: hypothetical protein O2973_04805 [Gemmatimonadetes bacterium]|nr:hypothetical protein [Gemmatimonadota bacterium]
MSDRNWDAEMKKIDRAMGSVSDQTLAAASPAANPTAAPQRGATSGAPSRAPARATTSFGVFARLSLAVALGIGIVFWPYAARCGAGLATYLGAVVVLVAAGGWSSIWSWRHRAAKAHVLSLLILVWGLVLGSIEVLPRIGYAVPTANHPAAWTCS